VIDPIASGGFRFGADKEPMSNEGYFEWARQKAASLKPKPPPAPEMVYAIGSMEYAAQQERLILQRLKQGEDEED
jgi:hypothetical protein